MSKRKIYSADIRVWATIYVIANSEREARREIKSMAHSGIEAGESKDFSGLDFNHPDLPEISFSPAMTVDKRARISGFELADVVDVGESDDEED